MSEDQELLGFPAQKKNGKSTFGKKQRREKSFAEATAPTNEQKEFTASGMGKPLLYEDDNEVPSLSAWNAGDTKMTLHRPIKSITADGEEINPSSRTALEKYNAAKNVIIRM